MAIQKPPSSNKERGTIIVDAGTLFRLARRVNKDFRISDVKKHGIHHYLGMLEYLRREGYRIIVPEMVTLECTSVLANGTSLQDYFAIPMDERPLFFDRLGVTLIKRLSNPEKAHYPGVELVKADFSQPDEKLPDYAYYVKKAYELLKYPQHSAAGQAAFLQWARNRPEGLGDDAIADYVQSHFPTEESRKNVFVLTNDLRLAERLAFESPGVNACNAYGAIKAFVDHGLLEEVGLKNTVGFKTITTHINRQIREVGGPNYGKNSFLFDVNTSLYDGKNWISWLNWLKKKQHPFPKP